MTDLKAAVEKFLEIYPDKIDGTARRIYTTQERERTKALDELWNDVLFLLGEGSNYNCARELCALMAEGEGSDIEVYRAMALSAMKQMDELKVKIRSAVGE